MVKIKIIYWNTGKMRLSNDSNHILLITGLLKVGKHDLLPSNPLSNNSCKSHTGGCYLAGDGRVNEHIGLVGLLPSFCDCIISSQHG